MEPLTLVALGVSILGPLIGKALGQGDQDRAMQLREQAAQMFGPEMLPQFDKMVAQQLGPSQLNGVNTGGDRARQLDALGQFQQLANSNGMTPGDQAIQNQAMFQAAQREGADRGAVLQSFNRRGMGGSGAELAAQLQAQQGAANNYFQAGNAAAQAAQGRKFSALEQFAQQAGGLRGQDYGEAANRAQANDAIARFNAEQNWNAQMQDNANKQNLFQDTLGLNGARSNAELGLAQSYQNRGNQTAADVGQFSKGLGQFIDQAGALWGGSGSPGPVSPNWGQQVRQSDPYGNRYGYSPSGGFAYSNPGYYNPGGH